MGMRFQHRIGCSGLLETDLRDVADRASGAGQGLRSDERVHCLAGIGARAPVVAGTTVAAFAPAFATTLAAAFTAFTRFATALTAPVTAIAAAFAPIAPIALVSTRTALLTLGLFALHRGLDRCAGNTAVCGVLLRAALAVTARTPTFAAFTTFTTAITAITRLARFTHFARLPARIFATTSLVAARLGFSAFHGSYRLAAVATVRPVAATALFTIASAATPTAAIATSFPTAFTATRAVATFTPWLAVAAAPTFALLLFLRLH